MAEENRPIGFTEVAEVNGQTYTVSSIVSLARGITYKGTVDYEDQLPQSGAQIGDCWQVLYAGTSAAGGTEPDGRRFVRAVHQSEEKWIFFEQDVTYKANKAVRKDAQTPMKGHVAVLGEDGDPVDSGIDGDNLAEKNGTYEDMSVGHSDVAEQLGASGYREMEAAFSFRTSGGGSDISGDGNDGAKITRILGNTLFWNQKVNNATAAQFTTKKKVTLTHTGTAFRVTSTTDSNAQKAALMPVTRGHTYYISCLMKSVEAGVQGTLGLMRDSGSFVIQTGGYRYCEDWTHLYGFERRMTTWITSSPSVSPGKR